MSRLPQQRSKIALGFSILIVGCGGGDQAFSFFTGAPATQVSSTPAPANQPPVVRLDNNLVAFNQGAASLPLFSNVSVSDDQANLAGGLLRVSLSGVNTDVVVDRVSPTDIGTVSQGGNGVLNITLGSNATPAQIASFLSALRISSPANRGLGGGRATVALSDGAGGDNFSNQPGTNYVVAATGARILQVSPNGTFPTIQSAINAADQDAVPGAVIVVAPGTYAETLNFRRTAGLQGLQLIGPNAGISAGAQPVGSTPPVRAAEANVTAMQILALNLNVDGFTVTGGGGDAFTGPAATGWTLQNSIIANSGPATARGYSVQTSSGVANVTLSNNAFRGWQEGFHLGAGDNQSFAGFRAFNNVFENNQIGLALFRPLRPQITGNSFVNNNLGNQPGEHLELKSTVASNILAGDISGNDFTGEGAASLSLGLLVLLEGNFWGPGGPVAGANVLPDLTRVDVDPFSPTRFTSYPH